MIYGMGGLFVVHQSVITRASGIIADILLWFNISLFQSWTDVGRRENSGNGYVKEVRPGVVDSGVAHG